MYVKVLEHKDVKHCLSFLHAFTGSDIFLRNVEKHTTFKVCELHSELTDTFIKLQNKLSELTLKPLLMAALEGMAVQIYSPKYPSEDVIEVRKLLFITSLKPLESIPPTKHALYQHVKRSVLAAHHWIQALQKRPIILPPKNSGCAWNKRLKIWMPHWSDLTEVSEGYAYLISCQCKVYCKGNCKWYQGRFKCTSLCYCNGMCNNNEDS